MTTYLAAVVFGLVIVLLLVWQGHHILVTYRAATGTRWQRFLAAFSDSITILWARFVAFASGLMAFAINALPQLDPNTGIGQALQAVLKPAYVPYYVLGIMVITEVARRSNSSVDPILPPTVQK